MDMENVRDIRVFYTRSGAASYLSHLDINRCFQRAVARSRLPVWHTQGFNPHIYITFALPTPLGYKSNCETVDLRAAKELSFEEIGQRLNAALPPDFNIYKVALPVHGTEAIAKANYLVLVSSPAETAAGLQTRFEAFLAQEKLPVLKKSKKGMKEIDLKPMLELLAAEEGGQGELALTLRLAAGNTANINPSLVFEAFSRFSGLELDCIRVTKQRVLTANPSNEEDFE